MEQRKRPSHHEGRIKEKLDKLADNIKLLPAERQEKLKELMERKRAYTTEEAAKQLGISLATLRRYIRGGVIAYFRVGPRIRISADEISRFGNVVNLKEAAEIMSIHPLTVRQLIINGKLPAHKIGRPYRIVISDLEKFMQSETYINEDAVEKDYE